MEEEVKVEEKQLSKREIKKLAKKEKKEHKKEQKAADRAFERSHPLRKRKIAAWIVELVGLVLAAVPAVIILGVFFLALLGYLLGVFLYLILIFGLLLFGLGYLIYAANTEKPSLDGYFGSAVSILNWSNGLMNTLDKLNGWFLVIFGGASLVIEIVGYVLLMTSLSACTKKHKISYIILMSLIITLSIALLAFGLSKVIPTLK